MISWLYTTFKAYCDRAGIKLLRDDLMFIERVLGGIPISRQRKVMYEYTKIWLSAETEGDGRRSANTFLREFEGD